MARAIFVGAVAQDGQAQRRRHEAATLPSATAHQADGVPCDPGVGIARRKADRASPPRWVAARFAASSSTDVLR